MDRIKAHQRRIKRLQQWLKEAKCHRLRAEIKLELAQCQLTIVAIQYGMALGYQKGRDK